MIEPICKVRIIAEVGVTSRESLDEDSPGVSYYPKGKLVFGYVIRESQYNIQYVKVSDINAKPEWIKCWDQAGNVPNVIMEPLDQAIQTQSERTLSMILSTMANNQQKLAPHEPIMLDPSDKLFDNLETINTRLGDLVRKVDNMSSIQTTDHDRILEHDKILVRGSETTPSLQETIRVMSRQQADFIASVEQERKARRLAVEEEEQRKKDDLNRWKWTIIGLAITFIPKFLWDAANFWDNFVVPALNKTP